MISVSLVKNALVTIWDTSPSSTLLWRNYNEVKGNTILTLKLNLPKITMGVETSLTKILKVVALVMAFRKSWQNKRWWSASSSSSSFSYVNSVSEILEKKRETLERVISFPEIKRAKPEIHAMIFYISLDFWCHKYLPSLLLFFHCFLE